MKLTEMIKERNKLAHLLTNNDTEYLDMLDQYTNITLDMKDYMDNNVNNLEEQV